MATIFLDECGYTGKNLLDAQQPVFTLAALHTSEDEAKHLRQSFFARIGAGELHYSGRKRNRSYRSSIAEFARYSVEKDGLAYYAVVNKRYALAAKIVDIVVETAYSSQGLDIYEGGLNIALANAFYILLPALAGQALLDEMLVGFQDMMREKTASSRSRFFSHLNRVAIPGSAGHILRILREAEPYFIDDILEVSSIDFAPAAALGLTAALRKHVSENIILVQDASSQLMREKELWDAFTGPDTRPGVVEWDEYRRLVLPMRITTRLEDSKNWAGLQLADILAGALNEAACWHDSGADIGDTHGKELAEIFDQQEIAHSLGPAMAFTPEDVRAWLSGR